MLGDGPRSRKGQRVRGLEGAVVGGKGTPLCGDVRVQPPLVQVTAALPALVDAG